MGRVALWAVVVALALGLGAPARSAPVTFDLSGVVGWWARSTDANASNPAYNGGTCTFGMQSSPPPNGAGNDCFRYAFAPGSSVSIDITGSAVTMLGGSLIVDAVTPLVFDTIVLTSHQETTIWGGATGTLFGDYILWSTAARVGTVGTLACTGPNCGLISMVDGAVVPFEPTFSIISGTTASPRLQLAEWQLDASHTAILGSSLAPSRWSNDVQLDNRRSFAFTFGPNGFGNPTCDGGFEWICNPWGGGPPWPETPEPSLPALVLLGLVSALRRRTR